MLVNTESNPYAGYARKISKQGMKPRRTQLRFKH